MESGRCAERICAGGRNTYDSAEGSADSEENGIKHRDIVREILEEYQKLA